MARNEGSGKLNAQSAKVAGTGGLRINLASTASGHAESEPKLLLQAVLTEIRDQSTEGALIQCLQIPWLAILAEIERNPAFIYQFAKHPRRFEEFIAASYEQTGEWDDVILTPRSRDGGRDVIVVKRGFGSLRILEQIKAYSPANLVTHDDVRGMLGVLSSDRNSSKGIITTTSDFEPGVFTDQFLAPFMPHRLETKNGTQLMEWLRSAAASRSGKRMCRPKN